MDLILQNNDKDMIWPHICRVYQEEAGRQLRRTKLTAEHVYLNPQSIMRVYLAAQVQKPELNRLLQCFFLEIL